MSLLAQVRQLQSVLAERDDSLKSVNLEKARLEVEAEGFSQRLRGLDESEQRYKDENWSLETQIHELIAAAKEATDREQRLQHTVVSLNSEKSILQRELDDLKQSNIKLTEDHLAFRRNHDSELSGLRKSLTLGENDIGALQRKVEELTSQNQELAKAVASRFRDEDNVPTTDVGPEPEEFSLDRSEPELSPPPSPSKGATRHTMLESETLKSSLHHAHRMIQNLKSNIHREKTEKLELKRMLQESRDELELRRTESNGAATGSKRQKTKSQSDLGRKGIKSGALGIGRNSRTDIETDEVGWEDHDGENSPDHALSTSTVWPLPPTMIRRTTDASDAYQTANETEDAFETANERDTTTETEAFQTGAESIAGDSSDDLTETESGTTRRGTIQETKRSSRARSFISTASTSADEEDHEVKTPVQTQPQRYRLKMNRGSRRSRIGSEGPVSSNAGSLKNSPASFISTSGQNSQTLFAELGDLNGDESGDDDADGTPSRAGFISQRSTPASRPPTAGQIVIPPVDSPVPPLPMVDSGMMTEPWNAEEEYRKSNDVVVPAVATGKDHVSPSTPQIRDAGLQGTSVNESQPLSTPKPAVSPPRAMWDQPFESFAASIPTFGPVMMSTPSSRRSDPSHEIDEVDTSRALNPYETPQPQASAILSSGHLLTSHETQSLDFKRNDGSITPVPSLSFSELQSLEILPVKFARAVPPGNFMTPMVPGDDASTAVTPEINKPEEQGKSGLLDSVLNWTGMKQQPALHTAEGRVGSDVDLPTESQEKMPFQEVSVNIAQTQPNRIGSAQIYKEVEMSDTVDQSSQTLLSADQIDRLLKEKSGKPLTIVTEPSRRSGVAMMRPLSDIGAVSPSLKSISPSLKRDRDTSQEDLRSSNKASGKMVEQAAVAEAIPLVKSVKRPGSTNSLRQGSGGHPPLPPDHQKTIAAAQRAPAIESPAVPMGPPTMPASAYRSMSNRPRTPSEQRAQSAQGVQSPVKPAGTSRARYSSARSRTSRRSSFSSFASELDERFNIRTDGMPMPQGLDGSSADPRMIQAITQTMIGEYLWKYTRKAGRGEMSDKRHRRFFWVHPYTRTLYWSDQDPSTAGHAQLKAKSVAIDTVRVVVDDNPFPPGLHRKSLIVLTPGRTIKFTATTAQRHETWFNAISYLLLRTGPDSNNEPPGALTQEDVAEFNPSNSGRNTAGSRLSIRSHSGRVSRNASRTGSRNPSPMRAQSSLSINHPAQSTQQNASTSNRYSQHMAAAAPQGSLTSRFTSYWRPSRNSTRGSISSQRSRSSQQVIDSVYNDNAAHDSAEDLRQVIERQDQEADRLENVRACCDGEYPPFLLDFLLLTSNVGRHDVGALSKRSVSHNSRHSQHVHTQAA